MLNKISYNELYDKQQKKLVRATFKKAVINNINIPNNTADVYFAQSPSTTIKNIPLSSQINASTLIVGDRCRVDIFDETNPNDMVIAYIYGRKIGIANVPKYAYGTGSISNGGSNSLAIAHGLGVIPDVWLVITNPAAVYYSGSGRYYTLINVSADATNLNATRDPDNTIGFNYIWFAIKF